MMFFFFVGGLEPAIRRRITASVTPCLHCKGSMDLVEVAQTLILFFIPVWTFAPKEQLYCPRCSFLTDTTTYHVIRSRMYPDGDPTIVQGHRQYEKSDPISMPCCTNCGAHLKQNWKFCPNCGHTSRIP
jgi:hypothetical protein